MKNGKKNQILKADLKTAAATVGGPAEKGKALASALGSKVPVIVPPTPIAPPSGIVETTKSLAAKAKRQVVAYAIKPVEEQSAYEQRYYMRNHFIDEPETVVRHVTNYGIHTAAEAILKFAEATHKKTPAKTTFKTGELINGIRSFGPACGDVCRGACRMLAKQNVVKIHPIKSETHSRAKYEFKFLGYEMPKPEPKPEPATATAAVKA
jgi:hypothetical protein